MSKFKKGDKVFRYYSCEPVIIYGNNKIKETVEVLGDPIEFNGGLFIPVAWKYSPYYPSLDWESNIYSIGEKE